MGTIINEIGKRHGRLTVIRDAGLWNRRKYWLCRCDCGQTTFAAGSHLREGSVSSCGCLYNENKVYYAKKGGQSNARKLKQTSTEVWKYRRYDTGYTFEVGRIARDGEVIMEVDRNDRHSNESLQLLSPKETLTKKTKENKMSQTKWSFKVNGVSEIDMASIKADLTRKNPIALIQGGEYPMFVVSDQLESKLQCCVGSWFLKDRLTECSKRYTVPISGVIIHVVEFDKDIKEFLSIWKEVRNKSLVEVCKLDKQATITVSLPKI